MTRSCANEEMDGSLAPSPLPNNSSHGEQRNLPSPDVSHNLPSELLASVFVHLARDSYMDKEYSYFTPATPSWVNVSYVCRYWRDVALNFPAFWSYIPSTSQRWTEELLARSQMAPLKISTKVTQATRIFDGYRPCKEQMARALSIVEQVVNHSERIQNLRLDVCVVAEETGYQFLSKFLFKHLPCLQQLEISHFDLPDEKSCLPFKDTTPALHTLWLRRCSIPCCALVPSDFKLTTLHLSSVGVHLNDTMADFLAMLRRMPHLIQLYVRNSLPSARDDLFSREFNAIPTISLPHLSNMTIRMAPLSAVTALLYCVEIPSRTKVELEVQLESTSEYISTLDEYVQLAPLLARRISQPDSPKFRSLTIGSRRRMVFAFSTSERRSEDDVLLKVSFDFARNPMYELGYLVSRGICGQIPLTNIQSVHILLFPLSVQLWRDMVVAVSGVRYLRFSQDEMPNITSMFYLPSYHLARSCQDGDADRSQGEEVFVPALEELELYQTTLKRVRGGSDPNQYVADLEDLYDAIATRRKTRCRLTIKKCRLLTDEGIKDLESVGWWEGDQFRFTSNV